MLIRKNTKAFKTIKEIITASKDKPDRQHLIRLYITKAGHSIKDRISIDSIEGDKEFFYDMNYEAIQSNLESSDRQLYESDEIKGIYFFHSGSNKTWDETPFEFDEAITKKFDGLSDLPTGRKKDKPGKSVSPTPHSELVLKVTKSKDTHKKVEAVHPASNRDYRERQQTRQPKQPKQPDYKLKHEIEFTDLERVIYRRPQVSKKDILDYYNAVSEHILPFLKDRAQTLRVLMKGGKIIEHTSIGSLKETFELPEWYTSLHSKSKDSEKIMCNDKSHLLLYAEIGNIEFDCSCSKIKSSDEPDFLVIGIESPDSEVEKAVDVALSAKAVLSGLHLPSFVKSDGQSGLHLYIPLDADSKFEASASAAEIICKLIRLKRPEVVALEGTEDISYGKVSLSYRMNEMDKGVVSPYSLVAGESPTVAAPLVWDEVNESLQLQEININTIQKRIKQTGEPFKTLFKKGVSADELLSRLEENYSFLF